MTHAFISYVNTMISRMQDTTTEKTSLYVYIVRYFQVVSDALICIKLICTVCINYIRSKLKITFLTNSVNRITGSYFFSVTGYDLLASFTALSYI